jgi:hypothetical protein
MFGPLNRTTDKGDVTVRKNVMKIIFAASFMGVALTLAGCSGGPSDAEAEREARYIFKGQNALLKGMGRPEEKLSTLVSVENISCDKNTIVKAEVAVYTCSYEASIIDPVKGDSKGIKTKVDLFESSEGWWGSTPP